MSVERAARAQYESRGMDWDDLAPAIQQQEVAAQRAAIASLREPSEFVVHAVCSYMNGRNLEECKGCSAREQYPQYGMIVRMCYALAEEAIQKHVDAILAEPSHGEREGT